MKDDKKYMKYDYKKAWFHPIEKSKNEHTRSRIESIQCVKYASDAFVPRESNWEYHPVHTKLNHEKELAMQVNLDWRRRCRERLGTTDGAMSFFRPLIKCPINGEWIVGDKEVYAQAGVTAEQVKKVRETTEKNWELRNHKPIKPDPKVYEDIEKALKSYGPSKRAGGKIHLTKTEIAERKRLQKLKDDIWKKRKEEEHKAVYGEEK